MFVKIDIQERRVPLPYSMKRRERERERVRESEREIKHLRINSLNTNIIWLARTLLITIYDLCLFVQHISKFVQHSLSWESETPVQGLMKC